MRRSMRRGRAGVRERARARPRAAIGRGRDEGARPARDGATLEAGFATRFGAADVVVAGHLRDVGHAIRPGTRLVRPRGLVLLARDAPRESIAAAIAGRGLLVTTSRCGDFRAALELLPAVPDVAEALVTATIPAERLAEALVAAADPAHVKVVVTQPGSLI